MHDPIRHLTEKEAAAIYGLSVYWFQRKRWAGHGPPYRKFGRAVRYPLDELVHYFEKHPTRTSTSEDAPSTMAYPSKRRKRRRQ